MSALNFNTNVDASLASHGEMLADKHFNIPLTHNYNIELSYEIHNKIENYIKTNYENTKIYVSTQQHHVLKTKTIETFYAEYIYHLVDESLIISYKTITENKESVETKIDKNVEILNSADLLDLIDKNYNIENGTEYIDEHIQNNGIYKLYDLIFYYELEKKEKTENIINEISSWFIDNLYQRENIPVFHTIGTSMYGYDLKTNELPNIKLFDDEHISKHYGKEFLTEYNSVIDNLKNKTHGLFLFYGIPGSGKTSLLRQIIGKLCVDKKIIYIPSYMIESIASPEFISFLSDFKDSILILEDAEMCLKERSDEFGTQAVSNILNLTNGLLNDSIKIQIIATFNMNKAKLDKALLRPGRLLNEWEFKSLSIEDSKSLAEYLNLDIIIDEPMTVSEIYNYEDYLKSKNKKNKSKKQKIGFE